jgi:hypothetical protein
MAEQVALERQCLRGIDIDNIVIISIRLPTGYRCQVPIFNTFMSPLCLTPIVAGPLQSQNSHTFNSNTWIHFLFLF